MSSLGGIPVSGGVAGKGTLISTNLLYSPLLRDAYGNALARPAFALGGTAGAAGFEAGWAIDKDPLSFYKTPASASEMTFTMIQAAATFTVYGIVLLGHIFDAGTVSPPLPGNFTSLKFEGGNSVAYDLISVDLTVNEGTLTPAYHLLASPQPYTHWRVRVTYASAKVLQLGEAFLIGAPPLAFVKNYKWGDPDGVVAGQVMSDGDNGIPRIVANWERLEKTLVFDKVTTAQKDAIILAVRNGHCILSPDGANGYAHFGVIYLVGQPVPMLFNQWNLTVRFIEAAR